MMCTRALVIAGCTAGALPALAQYDTGVFDAARVVLGDQHKIEISLDLDGDGYEDAIGWWWQSNSQGWTTVSGYDNDGSGRLSESFITSAYAHWDWPLRTDAAKGNFDGNAREDFAFGLGNDVYAWRSNGASTPDLWWDFDLPVDEHADAVELADLTGDGLDDVLVGADIHQGFKTLRIYVNPGNGNTPVAADTYTVFESVNHLITGEISGDATPDAILASDGMLRLVPISAGQFGAESLYTLDLSGPDLMPVAGDIDGDGDVDVVVYSMSEQHQVARRTGPTSFSIEPVQGGGPATDLADVDLDGDLDGACCGGGSSYDIYNENASTFRIAHNDGTGAFEVAFELPGVGAPRLGGVADMEHDGDMDLIAGRAIYYSDGPLLSAPGLELGQDYAPEELGDIDRDGDPDFGLGLGAGRFNLGDGTSSGASLHVADAPPGTSFVGPGMPGDFDGDGDTDLVVQHFDTDGTTLLSMRLLVNNGGGAFTDGGPAGPLGVDFNLPDTLTPNSPRESLAGDFDDDGDIDLAVNRVWQYPPNNWYEFDFQLWENDGAGHFAAHTFFDTEILRDIIDIDQDGITDLVIQNDVSWRPRWCKGNGDGTWQAAQMINSSIILYPHEDFAIFDHEGDGDLDVASVSNDIVRVSLNDGNQVWSGNYYPFSSLDAEIAPFAKGDVRLIFADLDGDGLDDLLAGPVDRSPDSMLYALREPGGGHADPVIQIVVASSLADVDGDGDLDMVGERIHFNRTHLGAGDGLREQYGASSPGTDGMAATLGARGPFRLGESPELLVTGAMPGNPGLLAVGFSPASVPGLVQNATIYVDPFAASLVLVPLTLGTGSSNSIGAGELTIPVNVTNGMVGKDFYHQLIALDLGAPGLLTVTNGMRLRYGD